MALLAIRDALESSSTYDEEQIDMIIHLTKYCLENSVLKFRSSWYLSLLGVPTGGSESTCIANIFVKWCLDKVLLAHADIAPKNKIENRLRFLDDLWFLWLGSGRQFDIFLESLNKIGSEFGITFKGKIGKKVNFLDVTTEIKGTKIETSMFIKPTDAKCFLNRKSNHSNHIFQAIPFSQFRRAAVISSQLDDKNNAIDHITKKLRDSGYKDNEIREAHKKVMTVNRNKIIKSRSIMNSKHEDNDRETEQNTITFVINQNKYYKETVKRIITKYRCDLEKLMAKNTKIIISERRNMNTASLLFGKSSFSNEFRSKNTNQKCLSRNCKTCEIMDLEEKIHINKYKINLDFRLNCNTVNTIYLYVCKHCTGKEGFYIGKMPCNRRANGHRTCFSLMQDKNDKLNREKYKLSALSYHIYDKHNKYFEDGLKNFKMGIIKQTSPQNLEKLEDLYIRNTKADICGLNRYKVMQ